MPISRERLELVQRYVATKLDEIHQEVCAPDSTITLIIRHPEYRDGYLITTTDSLQELSKVLERALRKGPDGEIEPPGRTQ